MGRIAYFMGAPRMCETQYVENLFDKYKNRIDENGHLDLPDDIEVIPSRAFMSTAGLTSISGKNVKTVGSNAFFGCSIESVDFPNVRCVDWNAFCRAHNLKHFNFGKIDVIGVAGFSECGLEEVCLPESLAVLDDFAFYGCSSLEKVIIKSNISSLRMGVFDECPILKHLELPDSIEVYDLSALHNTNIETLELSSHVRDFWYEFSEPVNINVILNPNNDLVNGDRFNGFEQVLWYKDMCKGSDLVCLPTLGNYRVLVRKGDNYKGSSLVANDIVLVHKKVFKKDVNITSVDLTNIHRVADDAFSDCDNLASVKLKSSSNIVVDFNAFSNCKYLETVEIESEGSVEILSGAFNECVNLKNIRIVSKQLSVYRNAFLGDYNIETVTLLSDDITPKNIEDSTIWNKYYEQAEEKIDFS